MLCPSHLTFKQASWEQNHYPSSSLFLPSRHRAYARGFYRLLLSVTELQARYRNPTVRTSSSLLSCMMEHQLLLAVVNFMSWCVHWSLQMDLNVCTSCKNLQWNIKCDTKCTFSWLFSKNIHFCCVQRQRTTQILESFLHLAVRVLWKCGNVSCSVTKPLITVLLDTSPSEWPL